MQGMPFALAPSTSCRRSPTISAGLPTVSSALAIVAALLSPNGFRSGPATVSNQSRRRSSVRIGSANATGFDVATASRCRAAVTASTSSIEGTAVVSRSDASR
jgi:hypothetical protein